VGRICQILVVENCRGRVANCWDRPQLFEVASEMGVTNGVTIRDGACVEGPVVITGSPAVIFLGDEV